MSEEIEVKVVMNQELVLSTFLPEVVDVVTELAREEVLGELRCANN